MTPRHWPSPGPDGGEIPEYALTFDRGREPRLLIVPALFDEANRLRRLTVEMMRRLDAVGIDTMLPDLPGTNESLQPLHAQTVADWQRATARAASHFRVTAVLGIRGGVWEPGLFISIPIVVIFFSYLFAICVLLGLITKSTIASLLLTLLIWFGLRPSSPDDSAAGTAEPAAAAS